MLESRAVRRTRENPPAFRCNCEVKSKVKEPPITKIESARTRTRGIRYIGDIST